MATAMRKSIYSRQSKLLCEELVKIRKSAGLTQRDLAKKLGRERSFVAKVELGERRVDLVEFCWICKACGVSPQNKTASLAKRISEME